MIAPLPKAYSAGTSDLKSVVKNMHVVTKAVFVLTVISIAQLVPVSGQLNCTQWRKLNAYDSLKSFKKAFRWMGLKIPKIICFTLDLTAIESGCLKEMCCQKVFFKATKSLLDHIWVP